MWELNFRDCKSAPKLRLIAELPHAGLPNGVLRWDDETVLVADTIKGQVFRFDTHTGRAETVLQDPTMLPTPNITLQFGVNGIDKVTLDGQTYLYYTNTELELLCRVPVNAETAVATGPIEVIARDIPEDDLLVLPDGTALVADNEVNIIAKVTLDGMISTLAGSPESTVLESVTSFKFGRTEKDSNVLYASTAGGYLAPINETVRRPANVVSVDLGP